MALIDERMARVFQDVFDNDALEVSDGMSSLTMSDWDSLAQVKIIVGLEEEFGVKFTTQEVVRLSSVGELKAALAAKGV